jgi:hypothetical protein
VLCFCFVFLSLVYPVLLVSLDCLILIETSVFSNVYLTIKTSASPEACIVEHHFSTFLISMLTFCLFSEFARNSSFFYLKRVCSVNNTFIPNCCSCSP